MGAGTGSPVIRRRAQPQAWLTMISVPVALYLPAHERHHGPDLHASERDRGHTADEGVLLPCGILDRLDQLGGQSLVGCVEVD